MKPRPMVLGALSSRCTPSTLAENVGGMAARLMLRNSKINELPFLVGDSEAKTESDFSQRAYAGPASLGCTEALKVPR